MKIYSRTIHANGICQHYLEAGDGPAVLLLHGFPETSYPWRFQIPELAAKYRVIAPDLRGYGETDKPSSGYDKRTMTTHLRELMRALNLPKIALVGHDRGARVATRFAKDHSEAVDRLIVMDNVPTRTSVENLTPQKRRGIGFSYFTWFRSFRKHSSQVVKTSGCVTTSPIGALIP
jgi:haloacetate dehalogenase